MSIADFISLFGGIALFLYGMHVMGDGLKKVAGNKMEIILFKLSNTPVKGILLGTGVTAVIQSSAATSVMAVGFVNSGMMKLKQAMSVILGSILGTSITGWIICLSAIQGGSGWASILSTETLAFIIAVIGALLIIFGKKTTQKHIGSIFMGLALLMFGMKFMSGAVSPLKDSPVFTSLITKFSNPLLGLLVGILLAAVLQSSSAAIGVLQALAIAGAINFGIAFPIVLGIGIGSFAPVLLSALGANAEGKRTALSYLIFHSLGALFFGTILYVSNYFIGFDFIDKPMSVFNIALLNSSFRFGTLLVLAPFIKLLEKFVSLFFKVNPEDAEEMAEADRLEDRFIEYPAVAIEQSRIATVSMARKAYKNLFRSFKLLDEYSENDFNRIQTKEDVIDKYEDKIGTYLVKIMEKELSYKENQEVAKLLHTLTDFERIGDHAVNISEVAKEISEKHIVFSESAENELTILRKALTEIVINTFDMFASDSVDIAYRIEPLEEWIDILCNNAKLHHTLRIQSGECKLDDGFAFNDLLANYERIADHCSNVAIAVIELQSNELNSHKYINELETKSGTKFNEIFNEYSEKYSF